MWKLPKPVVEIDVTSWYPFSRAPLWLLPSLSCAVATAPTPKTPSATNARMTTFLISPPWSVEWIYGSPRQSVLRREEGLVRHRSLRPGGTAGASPKPSKGAERLPAARSRPAYVVCPRLRAGQTSRVHWPPDGCCLLDRRFPGPRPRRGDPACRSARRHARGPAGGDRARRHHRLRARDLARRRAGRRGRGTRRDLRRRLHRGDRAGRSSTRRGPPP